MDIRSLRGTSPILPEQQPEAVPQPVEGRRRRRILLADGDRHRRAAVSQSLRREGLEVSVTRTGREAVDRALLARPTESSVFWQDETFDLILVSPQLSDMTGLEVARELRAQGYAVPIVTVADTEPEGRADYGLDTGFAGESGYDVVRYVLSTLAALGLRGGLARRPQ